MSAMTQESVAMALYMTFHYTQEPKLQIWRYPATFLCCLSEGAGNIAVSHLRVDTGGPYGLIMQPQAGSESTKELD